MAPKRTRQPAQADDLVESLSAQCLPKLVLQQVSNQRVKQGSQKLSASELQKIGQERRASGRENTIKKYDSIIKRFEWFLLHDEEGRKRAQPYDGNMVRAGVDVAVRFLHWVGKNWPGLDWPQKASELRLKVLEGAHSALQSRYAAELAALPAEKRRKVSLSSLKDDTTYGAVYDTLKNNMAAKGMRPSGGVDPQDNTVEDTVTIGQMIFLADMMSPREIKCIGPCPAFMLAFVQKGGKTLENGKTVKELESTNAVKNSMKSVPAALDYLALVVVQDALEDAERYPENPVHALLLGSPLFMKLLEQYEEDKAAHSFDSMRPMTAASHMLEGRGAARTSYASELASQQRSFQHLEAIVARMEPSGQPEDMVEAMEEALLPELGEPGDEAPLLQLAALSDSTGLSMSAFIKSLGKKKGKAQEEGG
ncbi:hypothetical protein WJX75_005122 [Coccomyxa subellipsoidea]|uniref:Uncharacterized protein n=1 Tax=Coccomyxa subellipsoidea TaxID=248742 RepID=A0ABR2YM47_9CHLO